MDLPVRFRALILGGALLLATAGACTQGPGAATDAPPASPSPAAPAASDAPGASPSASDSKGDYDY